MADDTPDSSTATASSGAHPGAEATGPHKPRRGIIMGKDGKPCRTCNSLADMTSFAKRTTKASTGSAAQTSPRADCPPDVEQLGRSSWTLLHSIAGTYPERPSPTEQQTLTSFMSAFAKLYPCWVCADDFQAYMQREKIRAASRAEFGAWLCEAHNEVNVKLGKKVFDCRRWEERWRTGWKDGSCD